MPGGHRKIRSDKEIRYDKIQGAYHHSPYIYTVHLCLGVRGPACLAGGSSAPAHPQRPTWCIRPGRGLRGRAGGAWEAPRARYGAQIAPKHPHFHRWKSGIAVKLGSRLPRDDTSEEGRCGRHTWLEASREARGA